MEINPVRLRTESRETCPQFSQKGRSEAPRATPSKGQRKQERGDNEDGPDEAKQFNTLLMSKGSQRSAEVLCDIES